MTAAKNVLTDAPVLVARRNPIVAQQVVQAVNIWTTANVTTARMIIPILLAKMALIIVTEIVIPTMFPIPQVYKGYSGKTK